MNENHWISLDAIRLSSEHQLRERIDPDIVCQYKIDISNQEPFPPLQTVFDGQSHWLWDGFHRHAAMMELGLQEVCIQAIAGTKDDAQDLALGANATHGLNRDNATKAKQVTTALSLDRHKSKSDHEIANLCHVSRSFVGALRRPETKEKQRINRENSAQAKTASRSDVVRLQTSESSHGNYEDFGPNEEELRAAESAEQADREAIENILQADDRLAAAYAEIKRLNNQYVALEVRFTALMDEKAEAVKMVKRLQKQCDSYRQMQEQDFRKS